MKQILIRILLIHMLIIPTKRLSCQETDTKSDKKVKVKSELNIEPLCQIKTDKIDDFTKIRIIEIQPKYIGQSEHGDRLIAGVSFIKDKLLLNIEVNSLHSLCFNENSKILLKLANDSILSFPYIGDVDCASWLKGYFLIKDNMIDDVLHNDITKVRIYSSEGYIDYPIKDTWPVTQKKSHDPNPQQYIKFTLQCALDQLQKEPISNDSF